MIPAIHGKAAYRLHGMPLAFGSARRFPVKKTLSAAALLAALVSSVATSPAYDYDVYADAFGDETALLPDGEVVYTARVAASLDVAPGAVVSVGADRLSGEGPLQIEAVLPSGDTQTFEQRVEDARDQTQAWITVSGAFEDCQWDDDGLCWVEIDVFVRTSGMSPLTVQPTVQVYAVGDYADDAEGDARVEAAILAAE
jgi:hypothetical protein